MNFLPIVHRELQIRARRSSTWFLRTASGGLGLACVTAMLAFGVGGRVPARLGSAVFWFLGWLAFVFCLLDGIRSTADALSREKREGTLGLLFLTDLRGYDVAMGKLAATALDSVYVLLALLPTLALPLVVGGVTGGEFWRLVLVLINTLGLSLAVGLAVSAHSRRGERAALGTFLVLLAVTVFPPAAEQSLGQTFEPLTWFSPLTAMIQLSDARFRADPAAYYRALLGSHLLMWMSLAWASLQVKRSLEAPVAPGRLWRLEQLLPRPLAAVLHKAAGRDRRSLDQALHWLFHPGLEHQLLGWGLSLCGVVWLGYLNWQGHGDPSLMGQAWIPTFSLHLMLVVWATGLSCFSLRQLRDSGMFEVLLTTPARDRQGQFLGDQFAVILSVLLPPLLLYDLAGVATYLQFLSVSPSASSVAVAGPFDLFLLVSYGLWALLDVVACVRFAQYMTLVSHSAGAAMFKTLLFVVGLPLLLVPCCAGLFFPVVGVVKGFLFYTYATDRLRYLFPAVWVSGVQPRRRRFSRPSPPRLPSVVDGPLPPPSPGAGGPGADR